MNRIESIMKPLTWFMALLVVAVAAGCSSGSSGSSSSAAVSSAAAITAYSLAGAPGTIDESAKTITVAKPSMTGPTTMVATFTTTGASVKVGTMTQMSGTTPNNFTNPVVYTVTAADGTAVTYTVTVTMATSSAKSITAYSLAGVTGNINETAKTIAVTQPNGTNVTALIATFTTTGTSVTVGTPAVTQVSRTTANDFTNPVAYVVTATDASTATYTVTVTVAGVAATNPAAPSLGEAGRFVLLAPAAITTTGVTAISNGDIGISPAARTFLAGFTAGVNAGELTQLTNGLSYAADDTNPAPYAYPLHYSTPVIGAPWTTTGAMLTQANTDLGIADTFLAADPNPNVASQLCPTELGTLVLTRGVYKVASNVGITTGPLHLDAQGDPNAVFIFNIGGTLTTGASGSIVLDGGAQAKNVYWRTSGITTIAAGTTFYGNVFATTQVNVLAGAMITGSLFAITDRITLISDTVTKAP